MKKPALVIEGGRGMKNVVGYVDENGKIVRTDTAEKPEKAVVKPEKKKTE